MITKRRCEECDLFRSYWENGPYGFCYENGTRVYGSSFCHNNKFKRKDDGGG